MAWSNRRAASQVRAATASGSYLILGLVLIDKLLGRSFGPQGGIVGAEEATLAVLAAEGHEFRRIPGIASQDGLLPSHLVGLLHDQGDLIIILGGEQDIRLGGHDLCELGAEVPVLGGEGLKSDDRPFSIDLFEGLFEKLGQSLGIIAGDVIQDGGLLGLQLLAWRTWPAPVPGKDRGSRRGKPTADWQWSWDWWTSR